MSANREIEACSLCGATDGLTLFSLPVVRFEQVLCEDAEACLDRWHRDRDLIANGRTEA